MDDPTWPATGAIFVFACVMAFVIGYFTDKK